MARKRKAEGIEQERAWVRDFFELLAHEATESPRPDPAKDLQAFAKWMQKHARPVPLEMRELYDRMRQLPAFKFRRGRDVEVHNWIMWILFRQECGDAVFRCESSDDREESFDDLEDWEDLNAEGRFDLKTCSLGSNPSKGSALSATLDALTNIVILKYPLDEPDETKRLRARRLYDAIRTWRRETQ